MIHIQDRVAEALASLGVGAGDRVGVACSGGPDSAVLAHVALALHARGLLGPVTLLHVDHGLRPASAADGDSVAALARRWGGAVALLRVEVDRRRASLEAAARDARYKALDRAAAEHALGWVLLAHTASDQAETVLMRMLRGAGVTGMAAIPPARGVYLRPLLGTTRAEVEAYLAGFDVPAVLDPMNQDPAFLRNRVRHRWLPALREENPRIDASLCRLAEAARQQGEVLDWAAAALLERATRATAPAAHPQEQPGDAPQVLDFATQGKPVGALDTRVLAAAPAAVTRRALALAAKALARGPGVTFGARHRAALHALVCRPAAGTVTLDLPGLHAVREYDTLRLMVARPPDQPERRPPTRDHDGQSGPTDALAAELVGAAQVQVTGPGDAYIVRPWQPGDRMRPVRLRGRSRKLSDLFVDARVPRRQRARALVVARASDGVIEWAQHIGPAFESEVSVSLTMQEPVASNKLSD